MAENLKVQSQNLITITQPEVDRANAAFVAVDTLRANVTTLQTQNAALTAEVARLTDLLNNQPPPPPLPPPPVTGKIGLYVSNGKLYTQKGVEFVVRGCESMCGSDAFNAGPAAWCKMQKDLGFNTISPLWQTSQSSAERLKVWLDAALAAGLVVGFNADHISDGRAFLCQPAIVTLCNKYPNIFLELEVETGWGQTGQQWMEDVNSMVKALRDAGHKHPIKVGSPDGGRSPRLPIQFGKQVLEADPLKNLCFTWQSYWPQAPGSGWSYQSHNSVPVSAADPTGAVEMCKRIAESGLCFIIGIDKEDDVGVTCYKQVMAEADKKSLSVQHWVLVGDFRTANNVLGHWNQLPESLTDTGREISALVKLKGQLAVL